jgi:hypothetical protein
VGLDGTTTTCGPVITGVSGAGTGTRDGPRLDTTIATASVGDGAGVAGSAVQVTTVSTIRQRVVVIMVSAVYDVPII